MSQEIRRLLSTKWVKEGDRGIYHKFNSASILLQIKRVNEVILNQIKMPNRNTVFKINI